jgi:hypothetical protein
MAFVLYAATLTHGIAWDDSAELAAGVERLGIVHQTGYPAYLLLGHMFGAIEPFGSAATRANLWSAACAALTVGLSARYVLTAGAGALGASVTALLVAVGPLFWYHATTASVYPFFVLVLALLLNAADAWLRRPDTLRLALFAAMIGLTLIAHKLGIAFAVAALTLVALRGRGRQLVGLAAIALPLTTIVYMPLRAGYTGFPNLIGDATTWEWVTGTAGGAPDVAPFAAATAHDVRVHSERFIVLLLASLSPAAVLLVPLGIRELWSGQAYMFCSLVPSVAVSIVVLTTPAAPAYFHLPLLVSGAIACGAGVRCLRRPALGALCALAMLVPVGVGVSYIAESARAAGPWSRETLRGLPRDARLVAPWTAYAPLRAVQELEGVRQDVRVEIAPPDPRPEDTVERAGDSGFSVAFSAHTLDVPGAMRVGPAARVNFKGLSGLDAGGFAIGSPETTARTYRLVK